LIRKFTEVKTRVKKEPDSSKELNEKKRAEATDSDSESDGRSSNSESISSEKERPFVIGRSMSMSG